jgi:EAL domain-containing protein (putative c-di-GMP-specific phosphodiesterase class I)
VDALANGGAVGRDAVEAVLADPRLIRPVFQPIVDLRRTAVWGFEMLARFGDGDGSPLGLLAAAERDGLGSALEARLVQTGIAARDRLPTGARLSINVSPEALVSREVREVLDAAPGGLGRIVLEVTERRRVEDYKALTGALDRARAAGAAIAVDDAGAGYAALEHVARLRPEYVKLDRDLVADADADPHKLAVIEAIGLFAGRLDAALVAEGIERQAEHRTLAGLAVQLGQGYLFGRPARSLVANGARPAEDPLSALVDSDVPIVEASVLDAGGAPPPGARGRIVAVVDGEGRPVGLAMPAGPSWNRRREALVADLDEGAADVARRALRRPIATRLDPVCACLPDGRLAGLVAVDRLLGAGSAMSRAPIFLV